MGIGGGVCSVGVIRKGNLITSGYNIMHSGGRACIVCSCSCGGVRNDGGRRIGEARGIRLVSGVCIYSYVSFCMSPSGERAVLDCRRLGVHCERGAALRHLHPVRRRRAQQAARTVHR